MYEYKATLARVVDGDTVDLNIDLGFNVWLNKTRVRLIGVDTPEKRSRDLLEKHFGNISSDFVSEQFILTGSKKIVVHTTLDGNLDKYGRILGEIFVDGISINALLIDKRYAVKYEGQNKSMVEEQHINNRTYLVENNLVDLPQDIQTLYENSK